MEVDAGGKLTGRWHGVSQTPYHQQKKALLQERLFCGNALYFSRVYPGDPLLERISGPIPGV